MGMNYIRTCCWGVTTTIAAHCVAAIITIHTITDNIDINRKTIAFYIVRTNQKEKNVQI